MRYLRSIGLGFAVVVGSLISVGCGQKSEPTLAHVGSPFRLESEPWGAREVLDVKDSVEHGADVVVVGRLGGGISPWVSGRAAFLIVDTRVTPSCDDSGDHKTCCPNCAKELAAATTMVKFLDGEGKVITVDARELIGLNGDETVVIQGVANRDSSGSVSVAATGVFVRR